MKLNKVIVVFSSVLTLFCNSCKDSNSLEKKDSEIVSATTLPFFNSADFTPTWKIGTHKIPSFSFTNQQEKTITNKTYEGKIYIANFFFTTCPGICPKLTTSMSSLQDFYRNDEGIMLLSHSVMPWYDSPEILNEYAVKNGVDSAKWNLVTGDQKELYDIARNGYFADEDFTKTQDETNFIHTENFILVDKNGFIRGVYNGTLGVDVERLKRHIQILKKEK